MRTIYQANWYDPKRVEREAIKAGWNKTEDNLLDIYHPDECMIPDAKAFPTLRSAVSFLRDLIKRGDDFWGTGEIIEIEVGGERCRYCTCRGNKLVKRHVVSDDGIEESAAESDCANDD